MRAHLARRGEDAQLCCCSSFSGDRTVVISVVRVFVPKTHAVAVSRNRTLFGALTMPARRRNNAVLFLKYHNFQLQLTLIGQGARLTREALPAHEPNPQSSVLGFSVRPYGKARFTGPVQSRCLHWMFVVACLMIAVPTTPSFMLEAPCNLHNFTCHLQLCMCCMQHMITTKKHCDVCHTCNPVKALSQPVPGAACTCGLGNCCMVVMLAAAAGGGSDLSSMWRVLLAHSLAS